MHVVHVACDAWSGHEQVRARWGSQAGLMHVSDAVMAYALQQYVW